MQIRSSVKVGEKMLSIEYKEQRLPGKTHLKLKGVWEFTLDIPDPWEDGLKYQDSWTVEDWIQHHYGEIPGKVFRSLGYKLATVGAEDLFEPAVKELRQMVQAISLQEGSL